MQYEEEFYDYNYIQKEFNVLNDISNIPNYVRMEQQFFTVSAPIENKDFYFKIKHMIQFIKNNRVFFFMDDYDLFTQMCNNNSISII